MKRGRNPLPETADTLKENRSELEENQNGFEVLNSSIFP
jgi:hypothetical protein